MCSPSRSPLPPPSPPAPPRFWSSPIILSSALQHFTVCGGGGRLVSKSCLTLATPWTVASQTPLPMGFSRQEYCSGLPFPSPFTVYIWPTLQQWTKRDCSAYFCIFYASFPFLQYSTLKKYALLSTSTHYKNSFLSLLNSLEYVGSVVFSDSVLLPGNFSNRKPA